MSFDPDAYIEEEASIEPPQIPELSWESPAVSRGVVEEEPFDPEAYLAEPEFDPVAYMAEPEFDPKAYVDETKGLSGRFIPEVAERLMESDGLTYGATMGTLGDGWREFYDNDPGFFHGAFYAITKAEQAAARFATATMAKTGIIPMDEAKDILARDQVHSSDIVNYYWQPEGTAGKVGRFVTGLALDIFTDPLSYVGIGALTKLGRTAYVGGKKVANLNRLSKAEQGSVRAAEGLEGLISKNAELMTPEQLQISEVVFKHAGKGQLGVDDLIKHLPLPKEIRPEAAEIIQKAMTDTSWVEGWRRGERGLTFGIGIPFTRIAGEVDLPIATSIVKPLVLGSAEAVKGVRHGVTKTLDGLEAVSSLPYVPKGLGEMVSLPTRGLRQAGNYALKTVDNLWTKTGFVHFDHKNSWSFGDVEATNNYLRKFEKASRDLFKGKLEHMGVENYNRLIDDVVSELDNGVLTTTEAMSAFRSAGKKPTLRAGAHSGELSATGELSHLITPTVIDEDRMLRLSSHPEVMDMIDLMRRDLERGAREHLARGINFNMLDVFGPGWARRYMPRKVNRDYIRAVNDAAKEGKLTADAARQYRELGILADKSQRGRDIRVPFAEAQELSLEKFGVKMYADDPIELFATRVHEMQRNLRAHDLMKSAALYARKEPQEGYVLFDPNNFQKLIDHKVDAMDLGFVNYVPKEFRHGAVYLPEKVHDRMLFRINGWQSSHAVTEKLFDVANTYTRLWRNTKLFGSGYVGLNATSNMMTYFAFNGASTGTIGSLGKATRFMMPNQRKNMELTLKGFDGKAIKMNGEQFMDEAIADGVFAGFHQEMRFDRLAEHVIQVRPENHNGIAKLADTAFLWRTSRWFAEKGDNIPRLATYLHYRQTGHSRDFAAEIVERQFFNYSNASKQADIIRKTVPFSTFPLKTLELVLSELKTGNLGALTIPGKVNAQLYGAYIEDFQVRDVLDSQLPAYRKHISPIHGMLMAGQREVLLEVPWLYNTLPLLMNPEENPHPVFQLLQAGAYAWSARDQGLDTNPYADLDIIKTKRFLTEQLNMLTPFYIRDGLAIAAMNGVFDDGGWFKDNMPALSDGIKSQYYDRYTPDLPSQKQLVDFSYNYDPQYRMSTGAPVSRFQNQYDFGQAVAERYGENWLFSWFFNGTPERVDLEMLGTTGDTEGLIEAQRVAARGEFIRRKFRQFTFGMATMSSLDRTFMANFAANRARENREVNKLKKEMNELGHLFVDESINDVTLDERMADKFPRVKTIIDLRNSREAMVEYYNWFLMFEHEHPNLNPLEVLMGQKQDVIDYETMPDDFMFDQLLRTVDVPDEEIEGALLDIYDSNFRELP